MGYIFGERGIGLGQIVGAGTQLAQAFAPVRQASLGLPGVDLAPEGTMPSGASIFQQLLGQGGGVCGTKARNPRQMNVQDPCDPRKIDTYVKAPRAIFKVTVRGPRRGCRRR